LDVNRAGKVEREGGAEKAKLTLYRGRKELNHFDLRGRFELLPQAEDEMVQSGLAGGVVGAADEGDQS